MQLYKLLKLRTLSKLTKCIFPFRFIDHLMVMFAELPPWDLEKKYHPNNLEVRSLTSLQFQGCCVVIFLFLEWESAQLWGYESVGICLQCTDVKQETYPHLQTPVLPTCAETTLENGSCLPLTLYLTEGIYRYCLDSIFMTISKI